ncbi:MAG: hypothetical protein RL618_2049 [Pseudomonadota bacterium]
MVLAASARCGGLFGGLLALKSRSLGLGRDGGLYSPGLGRGPHLTRTGADYRAVPQNCHCLRVQKGDENHLHSTRSATSTRVGCGEVRPAVAAQENKARSQGPGQSLVAGTGFEPVTFGL